jgi:zinc D-Ala-D-Ala carboxypeptidase
MKQKNKKLSENFYLYEFLESEVAKKYGIENHQYSPKNKVVKNLEALVENVLQPVRTAWGSAIRISSGYRSPKVNKIVNGVKSSQHLRGEASDIYPINAEGRKQRNKIAELYALIKKEIKDWDQIILYFFDDDPTDTPLFIHVSYVSDGRRENRNEVKYCYNYGNNGKARRYEKIS